MRVLLVSLVAGGLLLAPPVCAQFNPSPNDPQAPVDLPVFHGTFADFKRVDFVCNAETSGDYATESICNIARNTTRSGALDSGLDFGEDVRGDNDDGFVVLVRLTSSGTVPRALSALVQASRYYAGALDKEGRYNTPATWPRRGKLVMYEEIVTGVGQGDSLENGMRVGVRRQIQALFARIRQEQKEAR